MTSDKGLNFAYNAKIYASIVFQVEKNFEKEVLHKQIHQILTELRKLRKSLKISDFRTKIQDGHLNFGHMKILKLPTYSFGQAKSIGEGIFQTGQSV